MSTVSRRQFLCSLGALGAGVAAGLIGFARSPSRPARSERTETRLMMGTFVTVTARHESEALVTEALAQVFAAMAGDEAVFTRHDAASPLGVLNAQGVLKDAPRPLIALLKGSLGLAGHTGGGFNPATVPVLEALAASGVPSLHALAAPERAALARLTDPGAVAVRGDTIRLEHSGMGVSLDGVAKGRIVDLAAARLERRGVTDYLVNAGGDIRIGPDISKDGGWRIGIEDAADPARNIAVVGLRQGALATSGNYESRRTRRYDHIVPSGGAGGPAPSGVTVTAATCAEADALATALFAMGVDRGTAYIDRLPGAACLWQTEAGLVPSANWAGTAC